MMSACGGGLCNLQLCLLTLQVLHKKFDNIGLCSSKEEDVNGHVMTHVDGLQPIAIGQQSDTIDLIINQCH